MKCIEIKEQIDALLDNEIEPPEKRQLETHLQTCGGCRRDFENLQLLRQTIKQLPVIAVPAALDEKVLAGFNAIHRPGRAEPLPVKQPPQAAGWFGLPRFALAGGLVLLVLATVSAFQIGRLSAGEISLVMPEVREAKKPTIVEVPVIEEKIVEVPVIREKIVIRTVYVDRSTGRRNAAKPVAPRPGNFALISSVADNGYLTQTDLTGFQPVAEIQTKITKKDVENEK